MYIKSLSPDSLVIGAPAKINLFLEVLNKRDDGYHSINSFFQAVSLFDRIRFHRTGSPGVDLSLTNQCSLDIDEDNLVHRAYRAVCQSVNVDGGLRVELEKNIPIAAGLAGGSSDAAATIAACNTLFGLGLSNEDMAEIGLKIGSDIPFFFTSGQALVTGRGDLIEEIELPVDYWIVVITPDFGISSAESYASLRMDLTKPKNPFKLSRCVTTEGLYEQLASVSNDFEEAHTKEYPILGKIRDGLLQNGAMLARLTGSGPTVFGIFDGAPEISCWDAYSERDWQIHTVMPITLRMIDRHHVGGNRGDN